MSPCKRGFARTSLERISIDVQGEFWKSSQRRRIKEPKRSKGSSMSGCTNNIQKFGCTRVEQEHLLSL